MSTQLPTPHAPAPRKRGLSRSGRVRAVLALGAVVGLGTVATLAAWSDTGAATGTFSTGSLDLKLQGQDGTVAVTSLSMANAVPGTVVYANLPVSNAGTVPFTYGFTVGSTNGADATPLNANLNWGIVSNGTSATCNATTYTSAAGVTATNISPTTTLSAAPAVTGRPLAVGAVENLCFRVELPSSAPTGAQGRSTVATVSFTANQ
ncbi:putative ribosomally synthesized peptide with SipW-like signal peptide [Frondihabitans sp. PhB188]|uniref:SipW-dependent-type signal peptide-containing protein n=1 Tax=Frondihabitans sp. PhB188 TaxID=2485200 RepID=UPI000F485B90|nr:SipW-dependent-type signal peptide-containing protein [Frondihabitans sp. PhB188]ROQ36742.1 putative ribosomally synthesized peptide with SipW-like signal peptide [Frondihabitans sp. PhB188]